MKFVFSCVSPEESEGLRFGLRRFVCTKAKKTHDFERMDTVFYSALVLCAVKNSMASEGLRVCLPV